MSTLPTLPLDAHDVLDILSAAAQLEALEARFTAYRPVNEVGISFRVVERSGRTQHVRYRDDTYRAGERMATTVLGAMCAPSIDFPDAGLDRDIRSNIEAELLRPLGIVEARVILKPIRGGHRADGFIMVINLTYPATAVTAQLVDAHPSRLDQTHQQSG
jgi:hypothetical protein